MAKNYALIEYNKRIAQLEKKVERDAIELYASMALCLSDVKYGWTHDQIEELFVDIAGVWQDSLDRDIDLATWCAEVVDIDVRQNIGGKDNGT